MKQIYYLFAILMSVLTFVACSDHEGDGQPVITSVRSTANADSTFTEGQPGQMIVVQGSNLEGARRITVNNQEVGFNPCLCTSTHIIMSLPSELEFYGEHASFKNEIVVETNHGTASYTFDVLAPAPYISRYEAEWHTIGDEVKLIPGQQVDLYGENFYRISRIYMADTDPCFVPEDASEDDVAPEPSKVIDVEAYEVNTSYNHITLTLPQEIINGYLVVECKSGKASCPFSALLPAPEIKDLSSEMPIEGSEVTILGQNFMEVQYVNVNDEYRILPTDLNVSSNKDYISFVLPRTSAKDGFIEVVTLGGSDRTDFNPTASVFLNFDDKIWNGYWWGESNVLYPDAKDSKRPEKHDGNYVGFEGTVGSQWWWGVAVMVGGMEYPTSIPSTTSLDNIELRFEVYCAYDLMGTKYKMTFGDLEIPESFELTDRITGKTEIGRWMTVSIPLSAWMDGTYEDFQAHWNGNFNINTNPSESVVSQTMANYFDNFRIVKTK